MNLSSLNMAKINKMMRLMDLTLTVLLAFWLIYSLMTQADLSRILLIGLFLALNIVLLITQPFQRLTSTFVRKKLKRA